MLTNDLLFTATEWLDLVKFWLHTNLLTILASLLVAFLITWLLFGLSKGILYFLRNAIEWMKMSVQIFGILTVVWLFLIVLQVIFDPTRFCRSSFDIYFTRCQVTLPIAQQGNTRNLFSRKDTGKRFTRDSNTLSKRDKTKTDH